ncbi:MAG: 2'-deoxycytidine 5'-triphosphate deaminase domain-containing protein, partial [Planctomycetia bacterium]
MSATKPLTQDTLLVDRELHALLGSAIRSGWADRPVRPEQISPASIDLRLGARGWRMRAGFLPGRALIERTIADLALSEFRLDSGAVFERGVAYLVELEEELFL